MRAREKVIARAREQQQQQQIERGVPTRRGCACSGTFVYIKYPFLSSLLLLLVWGYRGLLRNERMMVAW